MTPNVPTSRADRRSQPRRLWRLRLAVQQRREARAYRQALRRIAAQYPVRKETPRV